MLIQDKKNIFDDRKFVHVQRLTHVGTWEWSIRKGCFEDPIWSEETYHIYGLTPGSPLNVETMTCLIHSDDLPHVINMTQSALSGGAHEYAYRVTRPSGEVRFVRVSCESEFDDGLPVRMYGAIQDITEQTRTEDALRDSKSRLAEALRIGMMGNWEIDIVNNTRTWSDEKCLLLGIEPHEFDGTQEMFINFLHPDDREHVAAAIHRALHGEKLDIEYRIRRKDGETRIFHVQAEATMDELNRPIRIIGTVQDITERKEAEHMVRQSEKLSVIGQLAAGIAHEIRNPLTSLKGFLQLMEREAPSERNQMHHTIMRSELERIDVIVTEMLALAKPQAIKFKSTFLQEKLNEVITLIQAEATLNSVIIATDFESTVPPVMCEGNQVKQVFLNIIKNAIEAMPGGGTLQVKLTCSRDSAMVYIQDGGLGIPQENVDKLGTPFYSTKQHGTGLGLLISQRIVDSHRGKLEISTNPGEGTTVLIILPIQQ